MFVVDLLPGFVCFFGRLLLAVALMFVVMMWGFVQLRAFEHQANGQALAAAQYLFGPDPRLLDVDRIRSRLPFEEADHG